MPSQSKSQQRFFGVVKAMQKGDIPKKGRAGKVAKSMTKKDVDDFASTKHKGKPEKVKQETKVRNLIRKMVREILDEMREGGPGSGPQGEDNPFDREPSDDELKDIEKEFEGVNKENLSKKIDSITLGKKKNKGKKLKESKCLCEKCWKGYEKKGTKKMFGKTYPNCVKKEGKINEVDFDKIKLPSQVNRFLNKFVDSMKGANLNRIKRSAILYKVINASGMNVQQLMADIQKIKKGLKERKLNEEQPYETILRQLGGNRFVAMTGAKNLGTSTKKDLSFSIGRNAKKVTHVHIKLTSMDLYDVEFINMRGAKRKVIKKVKGVYGDMLPKIFKKYTGMNVRL
jgi:hypothetical protein